MKQLLPLLILSVISCYSFPAHAQTPPAYNSADIYLQLKKLNVLGRVLYIAAHPDDENTRLLAYLAKEKQYRTGYLSLTRGDGGQNLIGDEQGIELGLIRTQELLAARRTDGAEQFFSRAYDFGFSKSSQEAMEIWGHDKILSDVVWVIRNFKPDVIITRFPGDERAGHGHHAASAILANEAFKAAADATMFTEQFKYGVQPWQARRILWNTFNFGTTNTTAEDQFKLDVGTYSSLLGKSFGEIASESRSQHKSQGFGVPRQRGQAFEYFLTTGGDAPKTDLLDGVNVSWNAVQFGEGIERMVNNIIAGYSFDHPEKSIDSLLVLYNLLQRGGNSNGAKSQAEHQESMYWYKRKAEDVKQIMLACSGLFAEATTKNEYAILGDSIKVDFSVNKRSASGINLVGIRLNKFDTTLNNALPVNQNISLTKAFFVPVNDTATQPYWLVNPMQKGSFTVNDQTLIGKAENDGNYIATFIFDIKGTRLFVDKKVQYKYTDPIKGELYEPLVIIPPVIVAVNPPVVLTNIKNESKVGTSPVINIQYKATITAPAVPVTINVNKGADILFNKDTTVNFTAGSAYNFKMPLDAKTGRLNGDNINVDVFAGVNGKKTLYKDYLRTIQYDHIPHIHYFYRDNVKAINEEIKIVGKNIGYIVGAGDKVPQALQQMGYNVTFLAESAITDENLKRFDAVIAGVRVYNTQPWINSKYDVLMRYIQNGGNYIVQYNTANFISSVADKIGPYPFTVSRTRVTDENAEVTITQPGSSVLNYPNKITPADFKDWIQERSIYQAEKQDAHYEAPLTMHDANETTTNGSLIITKYGKGNFAYTGLVFFRELPAGVAGAYRLMANLIALPQNN
ncbi:PIG-L family deacetylase [Panacibacter sp. DH6]|uniref:PIG-L family deacetylase n=1 Tax=Panacibacter microcysteis TaxID=2793269 RepID=A0A931GYB9_9BACT|nr:PIG-L family deacetylase [Panacibacter microcysteis]MBG9375192.1 PIG-L family deacetylase [Panacibacter microcysteis]